MSDIVERLGEVKYAMKFDGWQSSILCVDAAREITRLRTLLSEAEKREKDARRVAMEALKPFAEYKTADGYDGTNFLRIKDEHPVLFKDLGSSKPAVVIGDFRKARELFDSLQSEER